MRGRLALGAVVGLAFAATFVDFAGRLLSTLADGLFMACMVAVVLAMHRHHRAEAKALRQQIQRAQAREIAAGRGADALAGMTHKGEVGR